MAILSSLFGRPRADAQRSPLDDFYYGPAPLRTAAGVRIDRETALKLSAVWRCVHIIAGSVATLPLVVYRRLPNNGKERAPNHPLYDVLHTRPNAEQTSYEFREMLTAHLLLRGNAYAQIVPGARGVVDQLMPLHPDAVTPERRGGRVVYNVLDEDGRRKTLLDDEVFHVRGLSNDGLVGMGVLDYARETLGIGVAQDRFAGTFFSQAPQPGGVLEHPTVLKADALQALKEGWSEGFSGANAHKTPVLQGGTKYHQLAVGLTAEQAQLIAAREFTIQDVARWFGVPNHLVGETTKETSWGSGIEQMSLGFVVYTLMPWLTRWEQRIGHDLILAPGYFAEHIIDALLRADTKTRYEAYQIAAGGSAPWMNRNEIRRLENLNPLDGLDEVLQPSGMTSAGSPPTRPAADEALAAETHRAVAELVATLGRNGHHGA